MRWICVCVSLLLGGYVFSQNVDTAYVALKPAIATHDIIGLGEVSHGFETFNATKAGLLTAMRKDHENLSVIFESPFTACALAYLNNDGDDRLAKSLYPFWNTASVRQAIRAFQEREGQAGRPLVFGCDVQEDCRFTRLSEYLLRNRIIQTEAATLQRCDSLLGTLIGPKRTEFFWDDVNRDTLINGYNRVIKELDAVKMRATENKLLHQALLNRKWLCEYLHIKDIADRMAFRDGLMARNVVWIYENFIKKGEKAVLWSADTHIAKNDEAVKNGKPRWMGEHLQVYFKDKYYAVSLSPGKRGVLKFAAKKGFDAVLYNRKPKHIFPEEWDTPCP